MRLIVLMALCVGLCGCGSSGGGRSGFEWTQAPQFERDLSGRGILALDTIGRRAGLGDAYAAKWAGDAQWAVPEGYAPPLGPYSCNACGYPGVCVHAWTQYRGSYRADFCFAGQPVDATIDHEWLHDVIREEATDSPEVLGANNGHPSHVTIRGSVYRVKDLTPNAIRWPSILNAVPAAVYGVGRAVDWGNDDWSVTNCISGRIER